MLSTISGAVGHRATDGVHNAHSPVLAIVFESCFLL